MSLSALSLFSLCMAHFFSMSVLPSTRMCRLSFCSFICLPPHCVVGSQGTSYMLPEVFDGVSIFVPTTIKEPQLLSTVSLLLGLTNLQTFTGARVDAFARVL